MLICESYLLIYLEKWKDRKSIAIGQDAIVCLAGAGIIDLILREKLTLDGKKIKFIDTNPTGVEFLDEILTMVKESKKVRKLYSWITRIAGRHNVDRINLVFKSLENQGILQFEKRVAAKIFYKWSYNFIKPELIQSLLQQVQNAFIESSIEPEIELLCLLNLLQQSRLFSVCISKEYRNLVKHRMEQLLLFGNYDPSHLEMIKLVKKAIKSALTEVGVEAIPF
ncbi:MAG: GPP34 family phosphoprotein [Candidatus Lokiarchaeota archaeon]|nr:GPP34 family phosphoprotein [Candidatus Lokiarchaeota archaeon]